MNACESGDLTAVKILVEYDKTLLKYVSLSGSPLHSAITSEKNALTIVSYLLSIDKSLVNHSDQSGISPIFLACYTQNSDIVSLLIEAGANPLQCDKKALPLHYCVERGLDEIATLLI